uniref:Hexosyltransferase n=1 Tax=Clastoptera arizonana TaxID=38151 RepID=A0A1B6DVG6_9HEMI
MFRRGERRCVRYGIVCLFSIFFILALYSPVYQPSSQRAIMVPGWEMNISRNARDYVQPGNSTILIPASHICPKSSLLLLVIVCSAPTNFEQRIAIRETWASMAENYVKVAFLLGETNNETVQTKVVEESSTHADIIQEGFIDSYNNLTVKSLMMLKWVDQYCKSTQFLMKTDDDIYVNLPVLVEMLIYYGTKRNLLFGALICRAKPILDVTNKWYTPTYMFKETVYPNYLSGTGYVMSKDVASRLYKAALDTPLIHLEDVYITGICARAARLRPWNHPGFSYQRLHLAVSCHPRIITNHRLTADDLHSSFSYLNNCSSVADFFTRPPKVKHFIHSSQCH